MKKKKEEMTCKEAGLKGARKLWDRVKREFTEEEISEEMTRRRSFGGGWPKGKARKPKGNAKIIFVQVLLILALLGMIVLLWKNYNTVKSLPNASYQTWEENNRAGELWLLVALEKGSRDARDTAKQYFKEAERHVQASTGWFQPNPWIAYINGGVNLISERFKTQTEVIEYLKNPELIGDGAFSRIPPDRLYRDRLKPLFTEIGIKPGAVVGEIGYGKGYYTYFFSHAVGSKGQVYAVEVMDYLDAYLKDRLQYAGITNVTPVLTSFYDVVISGDTLDCAFMFDVYHCMTKDEANELNEATFTQEVKPWLTSLYKAMKTNGKVLIVDLVRDNPEHSAEVNPSTVRRHMEACGFKFIRQGKLQEEGQFFYQIYRKKPDIKRVYGNNWE